MARNIYSFIRMVGMMLALAFVFSCSKDDGAGRWTDSLPDEGKECVVGFDVVPEEYDIDTRSRLTAYGIETKLSYLALGAYLNGRLYKQGSDSYTSTVSTQSLRLEKSITYKVYAVVNVPGFTFPDLESDLPYSTISVTYDSMNTNGMPMAGKNTSVSVGTSTNTTSVKIPVKRLLAKVTATLTCESSWSGAVITGAKVCNLNGALRPFGDSAAASSTDIMAVQEIHGTTAGTSRTLSATFYVPENLQGTVTGITSSSGKSPEENATVAGRQARLTYLEVRVACSGLYSGTKTYRSYLGNNETTNFDIVRNCQYAWTVNYLEDGATDETWKKDGFLADNRVYTLRDPIYVEAGDEVAWSSVITSSTGYSWMEKTFDGYQTGSVIDANGTDAFSVKSTASVGQKSILTTAPTVNITADLIKDSEVRVVEKSLAWMNYDTDGTKKVYAVDPGQAVDADVDYSCMWDGQKVWITGLGGIEWTWTSSPVSGVTSAVVTVNNVKQNKVRYSVPLTVANGDYPITVSRTGGHAESDDAYLRVNDTRYLRWTQQSISLGTATFSAYSYSENEIHAYQNYNVGYAKSGGSLYRILSYVFGDISGEKKLRNQNIYQNLPNYFDLTVNESGNEVPIADSENFQLDNSKFYNTSIFVETKRVLPVGDYRFKLCFKDGSHPIYSYFHVMDPAAKEYRNLSVTITSDPTVFPATGFSYTTGIMDAYATYEERTQLAGGGYTDWQTVVRRDVTVTDDANWAGYSQYSGLYMNANNTGASRQVTFTASYTIPGTSISDTDSITLTQNADEVVSATKPVVTLSYPAVLAYNAGSGDSIAPELTYSQTLTYASGKTVTVTSGGSLAYSLVSNPGSAFNIDGQTGLVGAASNAGAGEASYGDPVVTLQYDGSILYTGGSKSPSVATYSQLHTETRASTPARSATVQVVVTLNGVSSDAVTAAASQAGDPGFNGSETITSGGTVSWSVSGSGYSIDGSGTVTAASNEGATTTQYGNLNVGLSYEGGNIPVSGGSKSPTLSVSQTKTVTRSSTPGRSGTATMSVTMNGKTGAASASVPQDGDGGSVQQGQTPPSEFTISYSMPSVTGFSINGSTGVVTALSNNGSNFTEYGPVSASLTYPLQYMPVVAGSQDPVLSYSQVRTTGVRASAERSAAVTVSVTSAHGNANASATVVQDGSAGISTSTTLTSGASVSYSGSGSSGMSVNGSTGRITTTSNRGTESVTYAKPVVTASWSPAVLPYTGGTSTPAVSFTQAMTTTRSATAQRHINVSATVSMNGKSTTVTASPSPVYQYGDEGGSSTDVITTGGTWSYTMPSASGFSFNSSTGVVTASQNNGSARYCSPSVRVRANGVYSDWVTCRVDQSQADVTYALVVTSPSGTSDGSRYLLERTYSKTVVVSLETRQGGTLISSTPLSGADVTWTSSNTGVATVVGGVVSGLTVGLVDITASYTISGQNVSATCYMRVVNEGEGGGMGDDWDD